MPDPSVKIHVQTDADTRGLDKTRKGIKDLREEAQKAPAQAATAAASSAQKKATNSQSGPSVRQAAARAGLNSHSTGSGTAGGGHGGGAAGGHGGHGNTRVIGDMLDMATGSQGWVMRMQMLKNLPHILKAAGPLAVPIAAVAVGAAYLAAAHDSREKDQAEQNKLTQEKTAADFHRNRSRGAFGHSGEDVSSALQAEEEISARRSQQAELVRKRDEGMAGIVDNIFGTKFAQKGILGFKTDGQRAVEDNQKEIDRLQKQKDEDMKAAQDTYRKQEGGLELQELRGRASRSLSGQRDAFTAQMGQEWLAKYKESMAAGGDDKMASEIAGLTVQNEVRDRQAQAGAGLVDAKSGAGEIASAARWGMQSFNSDAVAGKIADLHHTVEQGNQWANLKKQSK